ncbi:MAG: hypothetical protein DMG15_21430 [Acidobacteria bacterium]|nr:MAG: hypothetical protein DMG15_21430 [Acidobacteriota bacterium]
MILMVALLAVVLLLPEKVAAQSFDPHDLSGIWMRTVRDHSLGTKPPPLTQAGIDAMKGRIGDTDDVLREVVEAARASSQVRLNDNGEETNAPWLECNPMGFPRLLNDDEPIEFIITKDKILQVFQLEHRIRYLWTDGRQLPSNQNLENLGPAWYGHSVAKWDGDTLVINTVGLDERAWLDNLGYPKSFHARIEETWKRVDANTLESQLTLFDPEYYTAPYVGAKRTFKRLPDRATTYFGWSGLFAGITEGICAPVNEVEGYNKGFRDLGRAKSKQ